MARRIVYLARHGETDWNAAGRWQGHTDVPLNEKGKAQAREIAEALRGSGLGGVVSSDLSRAYETARIVAAHLAIPLAYVDADLRERAFGPFEGLTRDECAELHADAWRTWLEERRPPVGIEGQEALSSRVAAAIGRVAERVARSGSPALVVTHGGALRAAVGLALGALPAPVQNGAVWEVEVEDGAILHAVEVPKGAPRPEAARRCGSD